MAKTKSSKGGSTIHQKHIHSRLSYLHQAATLLTTATKNHVGVASGCVQTTSSQQSRRPKFEYDDSLSTKAEATRLLSHMRGVGRKSQIRLASAVKHTICKRCDSLLVPGKSSTELLVNHSKHGQKPWATMLEVRCIQCGAIRRFPVGNHEQEQSKCGDKSTLE
jgi:ribonuclease P protein subunit RPR2